MSKCIFLGQECDVTKLNQFNGRRVEISNSDNTVTFQYQKFYWKIDCYNTLILMDGNELDCKTYILMDKINSIKNITDEDIYQDIIDITYDNNQLQLSIICAESKPIPIKCSRCGKVFDEDEQIWIINQKGEYGSAFDGELISKKLCDSCISEMFRLEDEHYE